MAFILSFLSTAALSNQKHGQKDSTLKFINPDMVTAEATLGYATNFNAMDREWAERLMRRGEQIVHAQFQEHWQRDVCTSVES